MPHARLVVRAGLLAFMLGLIAVASFLGAEPRALASQPTSLIVDPAQPTAGKPVSFRPDVPVPSGFTCAWDVGKDGTVEGTDCNSFTHTFPTKGSFSVDWTGVDTTGATFRINQLVTVAPQPLVLTASCTDGTSGKPIQCEASATGGTAPYRFFWGGSAGFGEGPKFHPVFSVAGTYHINVLVEDANFDEDFITDIPVVIVSQLKKCAGEEPACERLANLWLCNVPGCANEEQDVEEVGFDLRLNSPVSSPDPKCTGFPNFRPAAECPVQTIGAFEFEVRFDAKLVQVEVTPGDLFAFDVGEVDVLRPGVSCASAPREGAVKFRCVTKGKPEDAPRCCELAEVVVRPTADVRSILIPNQLNGIATQLINQDCQLADLQGHPIPIPGLDVCDDAAVTIRYLEGDVHADCLVDVHDQQQIAFRWGSRLGQLLFNDRFDLEPSAPKTGDDDIDAKDLQLVYGRHGSTCKDPHPPQPPVDPKAKVEPPPAG